uniref:uncharacterized protein LOC109970301 n=1 Tax=Monopterus albus TaxID=43700 RepID=UPI0009B4D2CC|nr:uncharacterized protein C6orf226 homolog [Monopterus albus]
MEAVFLRFDSYDFEADKRFQDGLKVLHQSNSSTDETKLLDMKLVFYNRFVEPIDRFDYKQWSSSSHVTRMCCSVEQPGQHTPSGSDSSVSKNQTVKTEATKLSFAEVMRLVQEGKEVPGAIKLDIRPSNQSPTPTQMERIPKPWETASLTK